jgi:hypothetical protein
MTDPRNVINRILDADDLSRGEIFASLTVRSDLRPLFESARELTGSPEGRLFQGTYQYVEGQEAEVVLRLIPVELLGDVNPGTYRDVVVQITD